MTFLYSVFFGAGMAAFIYNTLARRVGYGNNKNVAILLGTVFILSTLIFYILLATIIHIK
jgi:hypothetical protein